MNGLEREIRRLKRMVFVSWWLLLAIVVIGVVYGSSLLLDRVELLIASVTPKQMQPINGVDGKDGKDGVGFIGPQGIQGQNAIDTQTIEKQPIIMQQPGEKGDKGDQGEKGEPGDPAPPAREPEFAQGPEGKMLWRLKGDTIWQLLEVAQ